MSNDEHDVLREVDFQVPRGNRYHLTLWSTNRRDDRGQSVLGYRFSGPGGVVVFEGEDFAGSPLHADDSDETVRSLMTFVTLRPGDTDREYFDNYNAVQRAFVENDAEAVSAMLYGPLDDVPISFQAVPLRQEIYLFRGGRYCVACAGDLAKRMEAAAFRPSALVAVTRDEAIDDRPLFCASRDSCRLLVGFRGTAVEAECLTFLGNPLRPAGRRRLAEQIAEGRAGKIDMLREFYAVTDQEVAEAVAHRSRRQEDRDGAQIIGPSSSTTFSLTAEGSGGPFALIDETTVDQLQCEGALGAELFTKTAPVMVPTAVVADEHVRLARYIAATSGPAKRELVGLADLLLEALTDCVDPEGEHVWVDRFIEG